MTGVEILLLVIGVVFFVASFFITEKLSTGELNKIGELSNNEIQKVMEQELKKVSGEIEGRVEEKVEAALEQSVRSMEKESNDKIMAISEYSDTVLESMNKTHNEIMFLYSMLNDKHTELINLSTKLQELSMDLEQKDKEIASHLKQQVIVEETKADPPAAEKEEVTLVKEEKVKEVQVKTETENNGEFNHNAEILALHKQGKTGIEIARELSLGLGEVQLVIGLYEGNRKK